MQKLMGYLAQFASFSKQGELLCTQSLGYLLLDNDVQSSFSNLLNNILNMQLPDQLTWRTEYRQSDGTRPDLEGCNSDKVPIIKIEAKLGAEFGKKQLSSYLNQLIKQELHCGLVILVPQYRFIEATEYTKKRFSLSKSEPWKIKNVSIAVITWERIFQQLENFHGKEISDNLLQLHALYRSLYGDDMEPISTDEQVLFWRERQIWWENLVDFTTRKLTSKKVSLLPLGTEKKGATYFRRYIKCNIPDDKTYYSIGLRDPFPNYTTPIWLRFHKVTGHFKEVKRLLENSSFSSNIVYSSKHIWYPLEVPHNE